MLRNLYNLLAWMSGYAASADADGCLTGTGLGGVLVYERVVMSLLEEARAARFMTATGLAVDGYRYLNDGAPFLLAPGQKSGLDFISRESGPLAALALELSTDGWRDTVWANTNGVRTAQVWRTRFTTLPEMQRARMRFAAGVVYLADARRVVTD